MIRAGILLTAIVLLTLVTQIGGLALLVAWLAVRLCADRQTGRASRFALVSSAFAILYVAITFLVVPPLAVKAGRVQLPCFASVDRPFAAANPLFCFLNRNYVVPRLANLLEALSHDVDQAYPGTITLYLDASFPFFDGFPLLPHLSHKDGRKLDLAYAYSDRSSAYLPGETRSPIGYWAFEHPQSGARRPCPTDDRLTLRWDLDWLQPLWRDLTLDEERTQRTLTWLFERGPDYGLTRVFVEPHIAERLSVSSPHLGFQGCRAARHDDHIHLQISS